MKAFISIPFGIIYYILLCFTTCCTGFVSQMIRPAKWALVVSKTTAIHATNSMVLETTNQDPLRLNLPEGYLTTIHGNDDDFTLMRYYTEIFIYHRGEAKGWNALETLKGLSQKRIPYDFHTASQQKPGGSTVARIRELLPPETTRSFLRQVQQMEANGWLSTNLDSVDGLPSLHINLISNGKPLVPMHTTEGLSEFQIGIQKLNKLVQEHIYDKLLPEVNRLLNTTSIRVSDVFLRRYGDDICGGMSRRGISAHYDVSSRITAVVALDDTSCDGTNGLFTTYVSAGATSNHAALRRFFPLKRGDCVIHTWDVLHGVDVEPGLDRTSLIVWFEELQDDGNIAKPSAWLFNHPNLESNDVVQFVLASALGSIDPEELRSLNPSMTQHELYLRSAAQGNSFALTQMGTLCEKNLISPDLGNRAKKVLELLRPATLLPDPVLPQNFESPSIGLGKMFWFEGAIRGNPLAQQALADQLMFEANQTKEYDKRLLACVLFGLAAQQGSDDAADSMKRILDIEIASGQIQNEDEYLASPIVQSAMAALL